MEQEKKQKMGKYIFLAIVLVAGIIVAGVTVSYAFFNVSTTYDTSLANISSNLDCINISYSETDTIDLDYHYPISDTYALANIVPVTVTVKNNCPANVADVNYTLALTSLKNVDYMDDSKIRTNVKRKLGTAAETSFINTDYLSNLPRLASGNTYKYLNEDLSTRPGFDNYLAKISYIIDSNSIANGTTNTYKIYLWVDYYEGDTTHTGLNDNSTQGQKFDAAISLIVNSEGIEPIGADKLNTLASASEVAYDGTTDNNLRYIGANPNNYVYFNCSDYNNPTASTCEKWRIIGAFNNVENAANAKKTLFKIIRNESLGAYSWDYKLSGVGSSSTGYGSNDWSDSQLMLMLNGVSLGNYKSGYTVSGDYLLDKNSVRIMNISGSYYAGSSRTYIPASTTTSGYSSTTTMDFSNKGLKNDTTRGMIEFVMWKLGGTDDVRANALASHWYNYERGPDVISGRPTEWPSKIGLMYPSDYGYATSGGTATSREICLATELYKWVDSSYSDCKNNDWLLMSSSNQWTLTPNASEPRSMFYVTSSGSIFSDGSTNIAGFDVRPSVYLKSDIVINGGNGTSANPFTIKVGTN